MANHNISWVLGAHVHFDDLDFIVTLGGELALAHMTAQSLTSINLSHLRLEGQPGDSLGPQLSREPLRSITLFLEGPVRSARQCFRLVSAKPRRPLATFWHYAWFSRLQTASSWG